MIAPGRRQAVPAAEALRAALDGTLAQSVTALEVPVLRHAVHDGLEGGKRIRPMVTLLMCEASGGRAHDALLPAAAIELLHASSLIHDDIMDGADIRRGKPSIHTRYGTSVAILAGDAMIALAFRLATQSPSPLLPRIIRTLTGAFLHTCEGQGYDLMLSGGRHVSPDAHAAMVEKKTARLLEAAAVIGALTAGTSEDTVHHAARFGHSLGMAFQAHDDLLDVTGDTRAMGKPAGVDRRNGRVTYLSLAGIAGGPEQTGATIRSTRHLVREYTEVACRSLEALPETPAREALRNLAMTLAHRCS